VDTTVIPSMRRPAARPRRRAAATLAATAVAAAAVALAGCGQQVSQDGGVIPVPHASTEGQLRATPVPVPSSTVIGPGYAPPRTSGPTQTAVPNIPGGKL
jgi:hypothetical protein